MKPKLSSTVYVIYQDTIAEYKVGYLGKNSFIIDEFSDWMIFDVLEWKYDDYGKTWFKSINLAKSKLLDDAKKTYLNAKIKKVDDGYWKIVI